MVDHRDRCHIPLTQDLVIVGDKIRRPLVIILLILFVFVLYELISLVTRMYDVPGSDTAAAFGWFESTPEIDKLDQITKTISPTPFQPQPTNTATATATSTHTATPTSTATSTSTPLPTYTPMPVNLPIDELPAEATINGVVGYAQSHNLTCEARSAVDWARYFGVYIEEMDFQSGLPVSDNPEIGFVGNIDGYRGQIPPASYGVHAPPVAALLRDYGLEATAVKDYSLEKLKRQIAKGNPVIVWVIGNVWYGVPIEYTTSDGSTVTVAYFEHTAIVVGYDEYGVTIVDNDLIYWRSTRAFLDSWDVLGNMAIIAR